MSKFVYIGGSISPQRVWKINMEDMSKELESDILNQPIRGICGDNSFLYGAGGGSQRIFKINPDNLDYTTIQHISTENLKDIKVHGDYLYSGGETSYSLLKINKNTLEVEESFDMSSTTNTLEINENVLFVGTTSLGAGDIQIIKVDLNDFSLMQAEFVTGSDPVRGITFIDDFVFYITGGIAFRLYKLNKNDLSAISSQSYGTTAYYDVSSYNNLVYLPAHTRQEVMLINPSDLSTNISSPVLNADLHVIDVNEDVAVGGRSPNNRVFKLNPNDLTLEGSSDLYEYSIESLYISNITHESLNLTVIQQQADIKLEWTIGGS